MYAAVLCVFLFEIVSRPPRIVDITIRCVYSFAEQYQKACNLFYLFSGGICADADISNQENNRITFLEFLKFGQDLLYTSSVDFCPFHIIKRVEPLLSKRITYVGFFFFINERVIQTLCTRKTSF